ncbi:MAG: hypothetical protein OXB90_09620, partial [Acidimicrobiaceae bacterium]|nr:hypothetical protein [Acidimicrobiaceae bacterium]
MGQGGHPAERQTSRDVVHRAESGERSVVARSGQATLERSSSCVRVDASTLLERWHHLPYV